MARYPAGPSQFVILASGARTATHDTEYFENVEKARGVRIYVNSEAGTGFSTTFSVRLRDFKDGGEDYGMVTTSAYTTVTKDYIDVYPGYSNGHIGRGFFIRATHGNANAHTYTLTGEWLP